MLLTQMRTAKLTAEFKCHFWGIFKMKYQIIHGDCIKVMKKFKDQHFDLVFADPPYNAKNIGPHSKVYKGYEYESPVTMQSPPAEYKRFCRAWFKEARRISKCLVITPGNVNLYNYPKPKWIICWHKPAAKSFNHFGGFAVWEPILVYGRPVKGKRVVHDYFLQDIQNFDKGIWSIHPCPKPLPLIKKIVELFSEPGSKVMDPFCGSGTTGVAAVDQFKEFVGIEKIKKYVDLSQKRIDQFAAQLKLVEV